MGITIGARVQWGDYGQIRRGTVVAVQRIAITIRHECGPMAGRLTIKLASSVELAT